MAGQGGANGTAWAANDIYDAVVVGASFAGLAFASVAAARGMRVLVAERDPEVGTVVRTTGILFSDVLDVLDVPQRYLLNATRRLRLQIPGRPPVVVESEASHFYMADVTGMLRWMAETARGHGAEIRCGAPFLDATREADGTMRVTLGAPTGESGGHAVTRAPSATVRARYLIGADGARSRVAQAMDLDRNQRFLAGAEWLAELPEGVTIEDDTFSLVMDHDLAPGYCVWLAPHGDGIAFGVAGHERAFSPSETLRAAGPRYAALADLSGMRVTRRKGGVIPIGGRLKRVYRDDARGRALLLGDAAGLCGAATGGGIYPALISGRLAAQAVTNEVKNGVPGAVAAYWRDLGHAGRLGQYLRIEDWMRFAMDRVTSNADTAAFYGLFAGERGRAMLRRTLLETPIIGMDGAFFAALRGLFAQSPLLAGSALRAAFGRLHRVAARG